jgi:hypothetical protein
MKSEISRILQDFARIYGILRDFDMEPFEVSRVRVVSAFMSL